MLNWQTRAVGILLVIVTLNAAGPSWPANAGQGPGVGFRVDRLSCGISVAEPGYARVVYSFDATVTEEALGDLGPWGFHKSELLVSVTVAGEPIAVTETPITQDEHAYTIGYSGLGLTKGSRFRCIMSTERHTPSRAWNEYVGPDALHLLLWRLYEFTAFSSPHLQEIDVVLDMPDDWIAFWGTDLGSDGPLRERAFRIPLGEVSYNTLLFAGTIVQLGNYGPITVYGFREDETLSHRLVDFVLERRDAVLRLLGIGETAGAVPMNVLLFNRAPGGWGVGCPGLVVVNCPNAAEMPSYMGRILAHELTHSFLAPAVGIAPSACWVAEGLAKYVEHIHDGAWTDQPCPLPNHVAMSLHTVAEISADTGDLRQQYVHDLIYNKPAWIMRMLHLMMGDSFLEACVAFSNLQSAQPLTEQDFIDTISRYASQDLDWFFEQWVHTTKTAAFRVSPPSVRRDVGVWRLSGTVENTGGARVPSVTLAISTRAAEVARADCVFALGSRTATYEVEIPAWTTSVSLEIDPDANVLKTGNHSAVNYLLGWYTAMSIGVPVGLGVAAWTTFVMLRRRRRVPRNAEHGPADIPSA